MSPHLLLLPLAPPVQLHGLLKLVLVLVAAKGIVCADDDAAAHELVKHQVGVPHLDLDSPLRPVPVQSLVLLVSFMIHWPMYSPVEQHGEVPHRVLTVPDRLTFEPLPLTFDKYIRVSL